MNHHHNPNGPAFGRPRPEGGENGQHKIYPPYDQVKMLAKAFDPAEREAWVMSGLPRINANEAQAAALGKQLWPTYEGRVNPPENIYNFVSNHNMKSGRGRHDWTSEDGDVQGAAAAYHELWYQQQAAAQHQQAAAGLWPGAWRPR